MFSLPANQRVIWFEQKLFPESAIYNVCAYIHIRGSIHIPLFEQAIRTLIAQNDALRSEFREIEGVPKLFMKPLDDVDPSRLSFPDLTKHKNSQEACLNWMATQARLPLPFAENKLYAFALLKQSDTSWYWYIHLHHTIADGWCIPLMAGKLAVIYEALAKGEKAPTEALYAYTDYIRKDEDYARSPAFKQDELYWKKRFATVPPSLAAGVRDGKKEAGPTRSTRKSILISNDLYEGLHLLASRNNVTMFNVFLGVLYTWFSRVHQTSDLVIGVPVVNRYKVSFQQTLGLFTGVLPFRMSYPATLSFEQLLVQVRDDFWMDFNHQQFPIDEILRMVKSKEPNLLSLFDIMCSYEEERDNLSFNGFETEMVTLPHHAEKLPLAVFIGECRAENKITIDFDFNLGCWDEYYMDQLLEQCQSLLKTLIHAPEQTIGRVQITTTQISQVRVFPQFPGTLATQFEKAVKAWPDNTAVEFEGRRLTYAELNAQSNALAHYLRNRYQVQPEEIVAFMIPRSDKAVVAMLGILKSGAAYLPIDPAYPAERKRLILEDSGTKLLLTESNFEIPAFEGNILFIDKQEYLGESNVDPLPVNTADHTCYVIYTSGSTGKPKGVVIKHAGVVNAIMEYLREITIEPSANYLQFASLSFDISVLEIFMTLFSGATLFPVSEDIITDFDGFAGFINEKEITIAALSPSYLRNLDKTSLKKVKRLLTVGEAAIPRLELNLRDDQEYYNVYGPTECTIGAAIYKETSNINTNVPIGKPIGNMQLFILDQYMQPMPYGIPGDIYIAGIGLAKEYLNNPVLTARQFIPSPFDQHTLLYRSGDTGRWLSDGNIEYLGRTDDQVKIRGHRIEPGEIEVALSLHTAVQNVAVIAKELSGNEKSLYAFVVAQGDITTDTLHAFLGKSLPHYMIPDRIFLVKKIPLTINGKVDKRALLGAVVPETGKKYTAPETENEKLVAGIWQELLGIARLSITDNFFQLGGHSLKVGQFINKVYKQTGIKLIYNEVFRAAVLKEVAGLMDTKEKEPVTIPELVRAPESAWYPQSSSQKRLYLLHQIKAAEISYNIPSVFRVKGNIDIERLEQCFADLVQRHEALRTAFEMREGVPVQIIKDTVPFSMGYSKAALADKDQLVRSFIRPFDLSAPPLLRAHLYYFDEVQQLLLFDMHHIISDGVSSALFFEELMQRYKGENLEPLAIQYKDFAVWHNDLIASDAISEQENYWLRQFEQEVPVLSLQTDFLRPLQKSFNGKRKQATLPGELCGNLEKQCRLLECTSNQFLLAAFYVLLYKYSGNEDIVVGTPVAGRTRAELDKVLGVFINTLPLRTFPSGQKTFRDFLSEVKLSAVDALKNQDYPFELLVDKLRLKTDMSRNPLFDIMFAFYHEERDCLPMGDAILEPVRDIDNGSKFDLLLEAVKTAHNIELSLEYCTDLFSDHTAAAFLGHYVHLLQQIILQPDNTLAQIRILTPEEEKWILTDSNNAAVAYPGNKCLHQLFEEQVAKFPDKTALVWNDQLMTYAVLDEKANQLAAAISARLPTAKNPVIAVLLDRSPDTVVALLGILKAGGAYLPIDPDYPPEHIRYILEDSGAGLLVAHSSINFTYGDVPTIFIDFPDAAAPFSPPAVLPDDLAYIIYTSGSTGKPKGVMIAHRNVVRLLFNDKKLFDFNENDTWTLFHSYCFDFSVWEMYGALLYGGKLIIIPKNIAQNAKAFRQLLQQQQVTVLNQTPGAFYHLLAEELEQPEAMLPLRYVIFGGEALKPARLKGWKEKYPDCRLINMYGITETTVHVTYKEISQLEIDRNASNIGKPIPTLSLLVMDPDGQLVPQGVAGELCVAGAGLAKGYLNRPQLTAERFIDHPYRPGEKLYRTGDLAKMLRDGDFEYLGRIDQQVKIRGFRIEPGEIENKLLLHPAVKDTLVIDREDRSGDKYLCAYVVTEQKISAPELRKYLSGLLPDYMVPAFFILMERFPLTRNGKIDRKQLPLPEETDLSTAVYEAPQTPTEKELAALWMKLLSVPKVGRNDHFFELGGHSLRAAQLAAHIHKQFHVEVSIRQIFTHPHLNDLAACIRESAHAAHHAIERAPVRAYYPASSAEKRLYILNQIDGAGISYNIPAVYAIEGHPDLEKLAEAIRMLVARHEILRTSFAIRNGEVIQIIQEHIDFDVKMHDCEDEALTGLVRNFIRPFDLSRAPLLRAGLAGTRSGKHFLLLDLHHIIADAVAIDILLDELAAGYSGIALPALGIQPKDFAVWQKRWLQSAEADAQRAFWKSQFEEGTALLNMPVDFVRPPSKSYEGALFKFTIPAHITAAVKEISRSSGATTFIVMLAAYNVLLAKYSGQEDIIVGTPVAGRSNADIQELVGMFVNTLALRNFPHAEQPFTHFVMEVKEHFLKALENQDYPFEELLANLDIDRDMSRNPLFDYMFTYRPDNRSEWQLADLQLKPVPIQHTISKMDLSLEIGGEENGVFPAHIEYATKLFSKESISRLTGHFNHILAQIATNPEIRLKDIDMLTAAEREQILHFNNTAAAGPVNGMEGAKDIFQLFEACADRFPGNMAVETDNAAITYRELERKVSEVATMLTAAGCSADKIVGLYTDRSIDMVVGVLAVLKAGGAYLPIDPEYPKDRVKYMLEDSAAMLLLTQKKFEDQLSFVAHKILLDELPLPAVVPEAKKITRSPESLAYVIYTSGSTGKPKGVQIEQHSFYNSILSNAANYRNRFSAADVCLSLSNITFDVSVLEIFIPLIHGAKLVLTNREHLYDVQSLANIIVTKQITFCYIPPSLLQPLYESLKSKAPVQLNKLFVGVEPIKDTVLQQYSSLNESMEIINAYGPTEAAVDCCWYRFEPGNTKGATVPIGKPLHNARIYIVNEQLQLLPAGIPGELCIAGEGLARGYLNSPEMTREKFITNPFEPGEKLYRTGDLAKWLPDGNIAFIGRKDHQVKVRGYRIELGEIESKLTAHPEIKQALVIDKTDSSGNKFLCAYVVSAQQQDASALRAYLATELPVYMIPSFFITMEKFPLTKNEKIDRKALPEPDLEKQLSRTGIILPADATEKKLLNIWQTILRTESISITDNFFEMGGDSLKIINMLGLIQQSFGDSLKVSDLFDKPNIKEQAAAISQHLNKSSSQVSKTKRVVF